MLIKKIVACAVAVSATMLATGLQTQAQQLNVAITPAAPAASIIRSAAAWPTC